MTKKATVTIISGENIGDATLDKLIAKSNSIGYLAEFGVPKLLPNASPQEVIEQRSRINHQRICAKLTNIRRSDDGQSVVADVEPYGPMAKSVKARIEKNMEQSLKFSIRSITKNMKREIITFDLTGF